MPDSTTPNYSLIKPEVTGSIDTWGGKLNGNFDILDTRIKANETVSGTALQREGDDVKTRTAKAYLFYDTDAAIIPPLDPSTQSAGCLMSNGAVRMLLNQLLPVGTIIMWYSGTSNIPSGWALCNGQTVNGNTTPNLTDRFLIGAGGSFAAAFTGGDYNLNYSGGVTGGTILSWNQMPYHTHTATQGSHSHPGEYRNSTAGGGAGLTVTGSYQNRVQVDESTGNTGSASAGAITIGYAGNNEAHNHPIAFSIPWSTYWPRFYAMVFIMRVVPF